MSQTVSINWIPIANGLPPAETSRCEWSAPCLVTLRLPNLVDPQEVGTLIVEDAIFHTRLRVWMQGEHVMEQYPSDGKVIAWAYTPEPYRG